MSTEAGFALFEVSWEVCNKVGGIYTVVSSKARTLAERLGDDYVMLGPLLHADVPEPSLFEEEEGFEEVRAACREEGIEIRVGRWRIPGRPRTILVGFASLFERKDEILTGLWERFGVDSLLGGWDYIEPTLFAHASGIVIDRWWHEYVAPRRIPAVAQFHEWMTGAGVLYLRENLPAVGTIFTTHATMLGRALASTGVQPVEGLGGRTPEEAAKAIGVRSKHSLEGTVARTADVFTTVSHITAVEAELFHGREAVPLLPNGLDLDALDGLVESADDAVVRTKLARLARAVTGENVDDALFVTTSGRYELHNKGFDVLLRALARLGEGEGRRVVAFLLVPAGWSAVRRDVRERFLADRGGEPLGVTTHDLLDPEGDPIANLCEELGLDNRPGSRVKVIHVPVYLHGDDGLLDLPYETVMRGMQLSCYPSFYEPWGYTPAESIALGVPTITTDCAGFGRWAREQGLTPEDGVVVLLRLDSSDEKVVDVLVRILHAALERLPTAERVAEACRRTARHLAWADLIRNYDVGFEAARTAAAERHAPTPLEPRRRPVALPPGSQAGTSAGPRLVPFGATAVLPAPLAGLERLAKNLWWSWDPEAPRLFEEIDPRGWEAVERNPVLLLRNASTADLLARVEDADYRARLGRVLDRFDAYLAAGSSAAFADGPTPDRPVAYFCFEYAVHEMLRLYAGGLGVLAGDHLKSASDLGLPLVAVGLFFRGGYVEQRLGAGGEILLGEAPNRVRDLPLELARDGDGRPVEVDVPFPDRRVRLRAWRLDVGRVPLYLLDANVEGNREADRGLTHRLYASHPAHRLQQEILLGVGGVRMLAALGIEPSVLHLNEGHAAFAALERVARLVQGEGLAPDEARTLVRSSTVFTTHTPIPAGHDVFDEDLIRSHFGRTIAQAGFSWERFFELGREPGGKGPFNMTYFALSFAGWVNGVSKKHGEVTRRLLRPFWPGLLGSEVPLTSITNGVHLGTWVDPEIAGLLGAGERTVTGEDFAARAGDVEPRALWEARVRAKRRLLEAIDHRIDRAARNHAVGMRTLERMRDGLDEKALVIGFARRLAPYKRADLLLRDRERLRRLLDSTDRPVRLLVAGKAHPDDGQGRELLDSLATAGRSDDLAGRLYFLENYDVGLGRLLVQGVDVWLNNPIPPLEASGTSGMKAAAGGALNLSVLDGWWIEACDGENGWGVGGRDENVSGPRRDALDASEIFTLLEDEVVPLFFERDETGLPRGWLDRARHAQVTIPPVFGTNRMVREYAERAYVPLAQSLERLSADGFARGREATRRRTRLERGLTGVRFVEARLSDLDAVRVGERLQAEAVVDLGDLDPSDVVVELVIVRTDVDSDAGGGAEEVVEVSPLRATGGGDGEGAPFAFAGGATVEVSGSLACGIRVRARDVEPWDLTLRRSVVWA